MRSSRRKALAAALGLVALASGCGRKGGAAAVVRASVIGTYPKESVALLVLEVKKVRALGGDVPWMKKLAALADEEGGPLQEVVKRLGAETVDQLGRLSVAVVPDAGHHIAYGVLAEGSFDPAKIRAALEGRDVLTLVESEGRPDFSLSVLPDGSLALGPRWILEVMRGNAAARGQGLDADQALLEPLERVRTEAQLWGALDCKNLGRLVPATWPMRCADWWRSDGSGSAPAGIRRRPGSIFSTASGSTRRGPTSACTPRSPRRRCKHSWSRWCRCGGSRR